MKIFLFIKPVIWLGLICYGLFLPAGNLPTKPFINIPHFDKMVHFALFFIFCLLLFRPYKRLHLKHLFLAPATAVLLGALLESLQRTFTVSRSSNFGDFLANATGIAVSVLFFYFFVSGKKWEKFF
jgi:VanZ family protein